MQSQEVSIKPTINIVLKPDTETLDEVVVIAYGTAKKESLTGSISVVDNKKIEKRIDKLDKIGYTIHIVFTKAKWWKRKGKI